MDNDAYKILTRLRTKLIIEERRSRTIGPMMNIERDRDQCKGAASAFESAITLIDFEIGSLLS